MLCGQCCLAMLLDVSLTEAISVVGHGGCTCICELASLMQDHGIVFGEAHRFRDDVPANCLLLLRLKHKESHLAVVWQGEVYDPDVPEVKKYPCTSGKPDYWMEVLSEIGHLELENI